MSPWSNLVQARKFSEQLDEAINRYTNRSLTTAEIIAELVKTKQMRDENNRHERLGLSIAEAAFYDAIVSNDAAVLVMGDEVLKKIAVELVVAVQSSATIDWSLKESVRAAMRCDAPCSTHNHGSSLDLSRVGRRTVRWAYSVASSL